LGTSWETDDPEAYALFDRDFGYLSGDRVVEAYESTDIFISPSLCDGFSMVLIEAMASGCAVVTTVVGIAEEICEHGKNCMLSKPRDVDKMVKNVRSLIDDTQLRDSIRESGLDTARDFSWEASSDSLLRVLNLGM
jgi:glycosyltransferase involved in cell wall biosynthesis